MISEDPSFSIFHFPFSIFHLIFVIDCFSSMKNEKWQIKNEK